MPEAGTGPVAAMTLPTAADTGDQNTLAVLEQSDPGDLYAYLSVFVDNEHGPGVLLTAGQLRRLSADLNRRADILMVHIDGDRALALLRAVVVASGASTVYLQRGLREGSPHCRYAYDGCPDCLIGRALTLAGVTVDELAEMDGDDPQAPTGIHTVRLPDRLSLTGAARSVFAAAQYAQDKGKTWGEALAAAEVAAGPVAS